jgi:hypothetical protein
VDQFSKAKLAEKRTLSIRSVWDICPDRSFKIVKDVWSFDPGRVVTP